MAIPLAVKAELEWTEQEVTATVLVGTTEFDGIIIRLVRMGPEGKTAPLVMTAELDWVGRTVVVPTTLIALDLKVVGRDVIAPGHSVMVFVAVGTLKTPPKAGKGKPTGDEIEELGMVDGQTKVGAAILETD